MRENEIFFSNRGNNEEYIDHCQLNVIYMRLAWLFFNVQKIYIYIASVELVTALGTDERLLLFICDAFRRVFGTVLVPAHLNNCFRQSALSNPKYYERILKVKTFHHKQ